MTDVARRVLVASAAAGATAAVLGGIISVLAWWSGSWDYQLEHWRHV